MLTSQTWKLFFCATDVRAIGKQIPREFLCVTGVHRKYLMEAPEVHKINPARKPCAADVWRNGNDFQNNKCIDVTRTGEL